MLRFLAMFRMETTRVLRDGNTLIYFAFPVIAYPMMIWGMTQAGAYIDHYQKNEPLRVAVQGDYTLTEHEDLNLVATEGTFDDLDAGDLEAVVAVEGRTATVHHRPGSSSSRLAVRALKDQLYAHSREITRGRAVAEGADRSVLDGYTLSVESTDPPGTLILRIFGIVFSMLAPISLVISAYFPLIELFVADRERQSLETTLTLAAPRVAIVGSKMLAAIAIATLAGVANIFALALTATQGVLIILDDAGDLPLPGVMDMLPVPFLLGSAAILVVTVATLGFAFARTFREAQTLQSPLSMILLLPLMLGTLAQLAEREAEALWIPLAHTTTLINQCVMGTASTAHIAIAIAVDLAVVGLIVALWRVTFGVDALIAGVEPPRWARRLLGDPS